MGDPTDEQGWIEKRARQRVAVRLHLTYRPLEEQAADEKIKGHLYRDVGTFSKNISAGGMLIRTPGPLAVGTLLEVNITLTPQERPLKAIVCIVRVAQEAGTGDYYAGFQFVGIHLQDTQRIEKFVQSMLRLEQTEDKKKT